MLSICLFWHAINLSLLAWHQFFSFGMPSIWFFWKAYHQYVSYFGLKQFSPFWLNTQSLWARYWNIAIMSFLVDTLCILSHCAWHFHQYSLIVHDTFANILSLCMTLSPIFSQCSHLYSILSHCSHLHSILSHLSNLYSIQSHCSHLYSILSHCSNMYSIQSHCSHVALYSVPLFTLVLYSVPLFTLVLYSVPLFTLVPILCPSPMLQIFIYVLLHITRHMVFWGNV